MGDKRRFYELAKFIKNNFPDENLKIADIASGKGYLQVALREQGYKHVISYDKRSKNTVNKKKYKQVYRLFSNKETTEFNLLVGLHPDEATDVIITEAARRKISFVIVPCCTKTTVTTFWGHNSYANWMKHLEDYAKLLKFNITTTRIPISGRNVVMKGVYCGC